MSFKEWYDTLLLFEAKSLTRKENEMTDDLKQRLRELSDSRKPYPTGAHGQMVGMESYRIVATGFALECVDAAADRIEQLEAERDQLREQMEMLRSHMTTFVRRCDLGEIRSNKTYAAFVKALADTEPKK